VRYLSITAGEPWAETWGVMLFPEDEHKRRAYIARLWAGFYPTYEETNLGEPVPRSVLLSIMKATTTADPIDKAEIRARYYDGMSAGEQLKVLIAIAQSQPKRASWSNASKLVERQTGRSRAFLYRARSRFLPVIHLWAAYILRGQQFQGDDARGYTALDDVQVFVTEAMALLNGPPPPSSTVWRPSRRWIEARLISGSPRQIGCPRRRRLNGRGTVASGCRRSPRNGCVE
jgi:hypothetical protein